MSGPPDLPAPTSELAALVEAEARFDRELAAARSAAQRVLDDARRRAADAESEIDHQIEHERARLAEELAGRTADELRAIDEAARAQIARFEAVRDEALDAIARALVERVVELARGEADT